MALYNRFSSLAVSLTVACGSTSLAELEQLESPPGTFATAANMKLQASGLVSAGTFRLCIALEGSRVEKCPSYEIEADLSGVAISQRDTGGWSSDGCTDPYFEHLDAPALFATDEALVLTIRIGGQAISIPIDDWKMESLRVPNNRLKPGSELLVPVEPAIPSNVLLRGHDFVYDDPALMEAWYHAKYPDWSGTGWSSDLPSAPNPTSPAGVIVIVPDTMPNGTGTLGVSQTTQTIVAECPFASCDVWLSRWHEVPDLKVER